RARTGDAHRPRPPPRSRRADRAGYSSRAHAGLGHPGRGEGGRHGRAGTADAVARGDEDGAPDPRPRQRSGGHAARRGGPAGRVGRRARRRRRTMTDEVIDAATRRPMDPFVRIAVDGGVAMITMDSPSNRNALSRRLVAELRDTIAGALADDAVR